MKKTSGMENSDFNAYVSRANKFTKKQSCPKILLKQSSNVSRSKKEEKIEKNEKEIGKKGGKRKEKNLIHVKYVLFTTFHMKIIQTFSRTFCLRKWRAPFLKLIWAKN